MKLEEIVEKTKKFLKEYEFLCQKYEMGLTGCGCCGSPILNIKDDKKIQLYNVNYNINTEEITIDSEFRYIEELKIDELEVKDFYIEGVSK